MIGLPSGRRMNGTKYGEKIRVICLMPFVENTKGIKR